MDQYTLYFDGSSKPNPGPAAFAYILLGPDGRIVKKSGGNLGVATNNLAEYSGLIFGLIGALKQKVTELVVCTDSLLLVKQINGEYKVRDENLRKFYVIAREILGLFSTVEVRHISHKENRAHDLSQSYLATSLF